MSISSYLPIFILTSLPPHIVAIYIGLCLVIAFFGINKKMGFWGILFFSIIFSPVMGLIVLLVSGKRNTKSNKQKTEKKF